MKHSGLQTGVIGAGALPDAPEDDEEELDDEEEDVLDDDDEDELEEDEEDEDPQSDGSALTSNGHWSQTFSQVVLGNPHAHVDVCSHARWQVIGHSLVACLAASAAEEEEEEEEEEEDDDDDDPLPPLEAEEDELELELDEDVVGR